MCCLCCVEWFCGLEVVRLGVCLFGCTDVFKRNRWMRRWGIRLDMKFREFYDDVGRNVIRYSMTGGLIA